MRLWARLALGLLPLAFASILGVTWATYRATVAVLERRAADKALGLAATAMAPDAVRGLRLRSEELLLPVLQLAVAGGAREAAALLPDGRVLAHTDVARVGLRADDDALREALAGERPAQRRTTELVEMTAAVRETGEAEEFVLEGGGRGGIGAIRVAVPLRPARELAAAVLRRSLLMELALSALLAGLALGWLKRSLVPLDRLAEAAHLVEKGDVGATVEAHGTGEVAELARRFNAMSISLKETTVSKAFFSSVLDAMLDGLIVAGPDGIVRLVNPAAARLLGREAAGRLLADVLPAAAVGRTVETEVGGTSMLCGTAELPGGRGLVVTLRDITARKRAERELARSNAEREQFAFIASHDLQEPLRKVASYCQLVQRRYAGKLDKDADDFLRFAVEGAGRMRALINDLLTYSRVGRGGQAFGRVRLEEAARAAVDALHESVRESGAKITIGELPTVDGHEVSLRQLLQNLLANAVKFRRPGVAPEISVTARKEGEEWVIAVRDNGIGIAAKHIDRVFEIFQRLHSKASYPGTGIGLAICRRVVENHGGRIWVESAPGEGSVFMFTLPEVSDA